MSSPRNGARQVTQTAAGLAPESWLAGTPDPLMRRHGLIGAAVSRVDGPLKVQGKARFAAEVAMEGLTYAALVHSTIACGRIARIGTAAAEAAPGVVLVMTYKNAPRMNPPALFGTSPSAFGPSSLPIMQDASIHWNGEAAAMVLAETQEQADHAASLIEVAYDTEPAVTSFDAAKGRSHPPESILGEPPELKVRDAEAALAAAAVVVERTYRTPRQMNATASTIAGVFGLKEEQVRVISPYVGGGFGGKCLWDHQVLAAAASKLAGRPVRIMLSREGVFRIVGGRTTTEQRVALGAKADGTLAALIHTGVAAMTSHNDCPEQFTFPARHLYAADAIKVAQEVADMNMVPNTFMRAPGESVGTFALECALDELAEAMALDPIELRRRIEPATDPTSGNARHGRCDRHLSLLPVFRRRGAHSPHQ